MFIFDKARKLRYQGRMDDREKPSKTSVNADTRKAIDALLSNQEVNPATTKVFGCSIKWAEKEALVTQSLEKWAKQPVTLDSIDANGIQALVKNNSNKLRLINIWATGCGPCVAEFDEFITIQRMYRSRDVEFVSLSADDPTAKNKVMKFLQQHQASSANYLCNTDDKYKLIEAVDPNWQGALPYTILVEPGGKIVYAKQGTINPAGLKRLIVEHSLIGRFYK